MASSAFDVSRNPGPRNSEFDEFPGGYLITSTGPDVVTFFGETGSRYYMLNYELGKLTPNGEEFDHWRQGFPDNPEVWSWYLDRYAGNRQMLLEKIWARDAKISIGIGIKALALPLDDRCLVINSHGLRSQKSDGPILMSGYSDGAAYKSRKWANDPYGIGASLAINGDDFCDYLLSFVDLDRYETVYMSICLSKQAGIEFAAKSGKTLVASEGIDRPDAKLVEDIEARAFAEFFHRRNRDYTFDQAWEQALEWVDKNWGIDVSLIDEEKLNDIRKWVEPLDSKKDKDPNYFLTNNHYLGRLVVVTPNGDVTDLPERYLSEYSRRAGGPCFAGELSGFLTNPPTTENKVTSIQPAPSNPLPEHLLSQLPDKLVQTRGLGLREGILVR